MDPIAGASAQRAADKAYGPGQTIGNEFGRNPTGLTAMSVLGGNTIYINPGLIGSNLQTNEGLLIHETLHLLGFDDQDIQLGLAFRGVKLDPYNTKNISIQFKKDCVMGKGNN